MKRFLILTGLVIILVSLNWFRQLLAQDITDLSEADRAKLVESYRSQVSTPELPGSYASPQIYDTASEPGGVMVQKDSLPVDSTAAVTEKRQLGFDELRPFGVELFSGPRETTPPNDIASDENYVLGPGDHVVIYLWGRVDKQYDLTVDREGKVFIPKVGELIAWGKSLGEFKTLARRALSGAYSDFDLMISLGKIRSIRIYLTGEVRRPGAYTVSSLTSLFNALYLAGGPSENGSMRAIRLMRSGKEIATVDLYKFLLEGDNSLDVRLESGDAIFVPVTGPRVAIRGEVKRPAVYELTEGETIGSYLKLAGGETSVAYRNRVMLERVGSEDEWEVRDLDLSDDGNPDDSRTVLTDGDRITVFSIFDAKKNIVAVFGQVKHPGYYERNDSARVSDLVRQGQLQDYDVHYQRANLFRRHSDWRAEVVSLPLKEILDGEAEDPLLNDRDSLHIYSIADVNWRKTVRISGCVQRPGEYPYYDNMTVADLLFIAGSYGRGASRLQAELARVGHSGEVSLYYVDLGGPQAQSTILREDDRVYVRWVPQWRRHRTVKLGGEVEYPGEYMLKSHDETLWSLLQRAGGFTAKAFPRGIVFERGSISESLDRMRIGVQLERAVPLVRDSLGRLVRETVFEYDTASVNRVVIDIDRLLETEGIEGDIIMEPGDRIFVPQVPSGISVLGAVGHTGTIKFRDKEKVRYYIQRAGNFSVQADKGRTRLIKANGEAIAGKGVLGQRVGLGDVVIVPTKIRRDRDFMRTLTGVISITTGALTTALLIAKL